MKTLATVSQNCFSSNAPKYFKQVLLYRRSWGGSAYAYDAAIDITSEVTSGGVSAIQIKLDTEKFNKWTFSNCTVTVRNDRQQWNPGNPAGYFPSGKQLFNSKVQIIAGVVRPYGTKDPQYVYTGYLSAPPTQYPDAKTIQLTVQDHLSIFSQRMADGTGGDAPIGTVVTNEVVGTNSGTAFTTANVGVGIITTVQKGQTSGGVAAASTLNPNLDYSTTNLNLHDTKATITLNAALVSGQSLWVTYTYWYLDQSLEWVVAQLCSVCGVSSTKISPAIFNHSIKNTFTESGSGFAGTRTNMQIGYNELRFYDPGNYHTQTTGVYLIPSSQAYYEDWITGDTFANVGVYVSPVLDAGVNFTSWGQFNATYSAIKGVAGFMWRTSADGSTWTDWAAITVGSTIPTTAKRYLQLKFTADAQGGSGWPENYPYLVSWGVDYYYSTTTIPVVNMTGLTCMDALAAIAEMCCYEIGFDSTDTFIFRPRSDSSSAVRTLTNADVFSLDSLSSGADRVYTQVLVSFGNYTAIVNSKTQCEASPNPIDIYGTIQYEVDSGNFLPDNTANLAQAIALTVYAYVKGARRRLRMQTRFFLDLELGDKVQLKYTPLDFITPWVFGDGKVRYGQQRKAFWYNAAWLAALLPLYIVNFRIEGIELDLENWKTTFDLTEAI
jgi:hypothetical protein